MGVRQHELANNYNRPHKKSARIVGDVIGKYHPHGDSQSGDALVRLAQEFSMRDPLVDGQGNFGSIDGGLLVAMRATRSAYNPATRNSGRPGQECRGFPAQPLIIKYPQEPSVMPHRAPVTLLKLNGFVGHCRGHGH